MMERFHFKQMITSGFSRTSLRSSAEPRRSLKGFEMLNLKLTVVTLILVGCFLITGCKDRESNPEQITDPEQISELKSRKDVPELIKIFVREGINHQETNMESDTMPPVVPHADSHHIEWSRALFTPALKALIDIGEPSVPSLLEEYQNSDKKNKSFTIKSAGWAIIHIGEPALSYIEEALQTSDEEERWGLAIMTSAIADKSKSDKAVDMLEKLQKDSSEKVREIAIRSIEENQGQ